jgi:FkbM family methyltransferase
LHVAPGAAERRKHHAIDVETVAFMRSVLSDGDAAIDVGAHVGAILVDIVALSPHGRHHAVEPLPELAAELRRSFPTVTVHECILGSKEFVLETAGRSIINRNVDDPGYSSVVRDSHPRLKDSKIESVSVEVRTLDDVAAACPRLRLVKIDVEGFELEVLRGAPTMLRDQRPTIVFEHERVGNDSTSSRDVHQLLCSSGYRVARLVDWAAPVWLDSAAFEASNAVGDSYYIAVPP